MDILDRLLGHDAWTTRQLLLRCRELTDAQLDRPFDMGDRSLRETFLHVIENMEVWTDRIAARLVRSLPEGPYSVEGLLDRLSSAAKELAGFSPASGTRGGSARCSRIPGRSHRSRGRSAA